jgi:hypothetical protein
VECYILELLLMADQLAGHTLAGMDLEKMLGLGLAAKEVFSVS